MIVNQQYIQSGSNIPVLICIIKNYDTSIVSLRHRHYCLYSPAAIGINRYGNIREFFMHLKRFVTYFSHCCVIVRKNKTFRVTFIPPAEYCHFYFVLKHLYQIFYMGSLARTTNSNVTHSDNGEWIFLALDDFVIKQEASNPHSDTIQP